MTDYVKSLARAMAGMNGHGGHFDSDIEGHRDGYLSKAEEILRRTGISSRISGLEAENERLRGIIALKPSESQKRDAAMSFNNAFGLIEDDNERAAMVVTGEWWLQAWQHEFRAIIAQEDGR